MKNGNISLRPLMLALLIGVLFASPAHALRVNFSGSGDADKIVFSFDSGQLPGVTVRRTGTETISISLPASVWNNEAKPGSKDFPGKLVKSIRSTEDGVQLTTSTNAFGYIKVPSPGKNEFVLQVYRDPFGARWKPPAATPPAPQPQVVQPQQAQPEQVTQSAPAQVAPQQVQQAPQQVTQQAPATGEAELPPEGGDRKPFFSVPYSVRTEVSPPGSTQGPGEQVQQSQPAPDSEAETGVYPPASELRFKAVNKMAEEVKFAELAGKDAGRSPVVGQVTEPQSQAVSGSVGGAVSGTIQPVESAGQGAAGGVVAPPPSEVQGQVVGSVSAPVGASDQRGVGGAVSPPVTAQPVQQPVAQAVSQVGGSVGGSVAPPPAPGQVVSGQGQVGGSVAPPPTVVQGAPPPALTTEESAQVEPAVDAEQLSIQEQIAQEEGGVTPQETPPTESQAPTPEGQDEAANEPVQMPEDPNAPLTLEQQEQLIRDKLYEAQSMMFNGALANALPIYEDILKQPNVPDDVREETLYAVADIKKEMHGDELDEYFEEIAQAYIEAMNANLRSNRVPRALLALGLINLKVGNFPEAKAYFKILQEKYPDDDNIPSISYYWGEYYYRKGDFKKAADQFQYLIQTYPEHELVKQAAYYLADSLDRTGFIEQAFQIVDYIDKRWPDYYMENPQFLRLAGGVEMKLKKWPEAKNHYFTYYNLNPEAEGADVVLARLGDIYIRENRKDAGKVMYQKAVKDYPDREGGLVAKMRLAEEGIYDEPRMSEMASVFDRPYNKRPEAIYKEIIENHPDSPLAPIAQLKLAMWYGFNEKYPEALTAAQDFIEKYPDSQFIDRARKLGDSVFALAVPQMVGEERYGRVVRYWETYDFIGTEDTKVDDRTRLNVATSYWKVGQPEKALAIIKPFLKKKQIPDISEEALGLAVNIYLDQLAWKEIADIVEMAKENWKLKESQLRQLDYARAMSLQNLGDSNKALAMWAELAKDVQVAPEFRAYAMYYMAKAAMERQDLRKVFVYAQEALTLLLQTKGDPEKIKDAVLMSIYATERSGRYDEALKWAKQYDQYIDVDNPEWASTRFKLARIYRKAGAMEEWKQLLSDIIEKKPESLQAKLAKSALDTYELEQQVEQYSPGPQ